MHTMFPSRFRPYYLGPSKLDSNVVKTRLEIERGEIGLKKGIQSQFYNFHEHLHVV